MTTLTLDTSAIEKLSENFAATFKKRDFAALGGFFADTAVLLPPGSLMLGGRNDIRAYWGRTRIQSLTFESAEIVSLGDGLVRETGQLHLVSKSEQGPVAAMAKYLVLRRKIETRWQIEAMIWNSMPANPRGAGASVNKSANKAPDKPERPAFVPRVP